LVELFIGDPLVFLGKGRGGNMPLRIVLPEVRRIPTEQMLEI
jgi:hypothetical protein